MGFLLSVNAGSSSIKCAAYVVHDQPEQICTVAVENIGEDSAVLITKTTSGPEVTANIVAPNHTTAMELILDWCASQMPLEDVEAIGHRIVHGGTIFTGATLITQDTIHALHSLSTLDPVHMPAALETMAVINERLADAPQVACFDTAFFAHIPMAAQLVALPKHIRKMGVRRLGFHGLSYAYLLKSFTENEGETAAHGRVIMAHLGSGASLAATKNGQPVDMTMGFTPASGVPMSTRTGDIDPGIVSFLQRELGQTAEEFDHMVNKESGLLAVSETTADMHDLLQAQADDPRAAQAIEFFCYEISKAIGSLTTTIGGLDSLIFAGGIGERSAEIRSRICKNIEHLGVKLDLEANHASSRCISDPESDVGVHVIHTDESITIANETLKTIKENQAK
jgi:acetate kinase